MAGSASFAAPAGATAARRGAAGAGSDGTAAYGPANSTCVTGFFGSAPALALSDAADLVETRRVRTGFAPPVPGGTIPAAPRPEADSGEGASVAPVAASFPA